MNAAPAVVLLTGATGFVGKVVLAELLRRREALGIARVLALVRARDPEQADARLRSEVLASPCFAGEEPGFEKGVEALAGDITQPGLGLAAEAQGRALAEVSHVIHCAASVEFSLPVAEAAAVNAGGALHALELARACPRLASLVVVSTAYVTPHAAPRAGSVQRVEEQLAPLPFDAEALLPRMLAGEADAARLLGETGHPNTYTLTKCVAEHVVARRAAGLPVTLLRPSIVSASRARPRPGWVDSTAAFAGFVALIGAGRLRVVAGDPEARVDVVPCDAVAERIVDAAFDPPATSALRIRHAAAGLDGALRIELCRERILRHFEARPGDPPARLAYVGPRGWRFHLAHALHHELPGFAAALALRVRGDARLARQAQRLRERQRSLNRDFAYFTHATFDFRSAAPLAPPLDPARYLDTVCEGVERHLLRREPTTRSSAGRAGA
jgi:thioester reductase-like protein